jgi:hypothetical protein
LLSQGKAFENGKGSGVWKRRAEVRIEIILTKVLINSTLSLVVFVSA